MGGKLSRQVRVGSSFSPPKPLRTYMEPALAVEHIRKVLEVTQCTQLYSVVLSDLYSVTSRSRFVLTVLEGDLSWALWPPPQ